MWQGNNPDCYRVLNIYLGPRFTYYITDDAIRRNTVYRLSNSVGLTPLSTTYFASEPYRAFSGSMFTTSKSGCKNTRSSYDIGSYISVFLSESDMAWCHHPLPFSIMYPPLNIASIIVSAIRVTTAQHRVTTLIHCLGCVHMCPRDLIGWIFV